jgi:hypothetical protein
MTKCFAWGELDRCAHLEEVPGVELVVELELKLKVASRRVNE